MVLFEKSNAIAVINADLTLLKGMEEQVIQSPQKMKYLLFELFATNWTGKTVV